MAGLGEGYRQVIGEFFELLLVHPYGGNPGAEEAGIVGTQRFLDGIGFGKIAEQHFTKFRVFQIERAPVHYEYFRNPFVVQAF